MSDERKMNQSIGQWATEPSDQLRVGWQVGDYRLEERLGQGGMGEIWKAYSQTEERHVAIKFVPPVLSVHPDEMQRVKDTFQRIHALQHQHICPVYQLGEDPKFGYFVVMKFVDALTLPEYRRQYASEHGAFPRGEVIRTLRPVAEALDYAHSKRVVHRDIKPQNIMISKDGDDVQVVDFGLADEIRTSVSRVSQVRMDSSGTYPYMAPEQWRGQYQDAKTDQYALGVVAYELLSGRLPFEAIDDHILRMCVLNETAAPLEDQPPQVNEAFRRVLAKERKDRFDDCRHFVHALALAETSPAVIQPPPLNVETKGKPNDTVPASPAPAGPVVPASPEQQRQVASTPAKNKSSRNRWLVGIAVCVLLLVTAAAVVFFVIQSMTSDDSPSISTQYVPENCFAAVVIRPAQILQSKQLADVPIEQLLAGEQGAFKRSFGFDPRYLEQVHVLLTLADKDVSPSPVPLYLGIVFRFAEPYDKVAIQRHLEVQYGIESYDWNYGGAPHYHSFGMNCWAFADERTILCTNRTFLLPEELDPDWNGEFVREQNPLIARMLAAKGNTGSLCRVLSQLDSKNDIAAAFTTDPILGDLKRMKTAPDFREDRTFPMIERIIEAIEGVEQATVTANLDPVPKAEMMIDAESETAAQEIETLINMGRGLGTLGLGELRREMDGGFEAHVVDGFISGLDALIKGTKPQVNKSEVRIPITAPKNLTDAFRSMLRQMPEKAERSARLMDLRNLAWAMESYETQHGNFPAAAAPSDTGKVIEESSQVSWRVQILNYMSEGEDIHRQYRLDEPWDSSHNIRLLEKIPSWLQTPGAKPGWTSVMVFTGPQTAFGDGTSKPSSRDIPDGLSKTIMFVEAGADVAVPWTKPVDLRFDPADPLGPLGSIRRKGFPAAFFGGHAEWIPGDIEPGTLRALITNKGGESVSYDDF